MRILAVVYCFPPLLLPSALCYLKLALGLRARGVEVEILAIAPESFHGHMPGLTDPSILRVVPADLVQHLVRSPEAHPGVRALQRLIGTTPAGLALFEPKKREWTFPAWRLLRRLDLARYDLVLTCSQPHVNHLLGLKLKERAGLPWIAYFSDPWMRNPYTRFRTRRIERYHRAWERRVLEGADRVLYTSPEMLRLAEEDHGAVLRGKSGVLPHAFVPDWYGPPRAAARESGPLRIVHTGHFYGPRSPAPLIDALTCLQRRHDLAARLRIDSYGSFPDADRATLAQRNLEPVLRVHAIVPYLDSLALMRQCEALLLIDAKLTQTAESVFLPSKLVDYLGSGTPVIAITPTRGSTARVAAETGAVVCDIEDAQAIDAVFDRLLASGSLPAPDPSAVRAYHFEETAAGLERLMREVARR